MLSDESLKVLEELAKLAPLGTAFIALVAAIIAFTAMYVQRDVARRRAAIDFFFKTEMDDKIIEIYKKFEETIPGIAALVSNPTFGPNSPEHHDLRKWLNICELIAVGVNKGAFSENISLDYWGDIIPDTFNDALLYIRYIRRTPRMGGPLTYCEQERLCEKWRGR